MYDMYNRIIREFGVFMKKIFETFKPTRMTQCTRFIERY